MNGKMCRTMGQIPSTMKPHKTGCVWKHLPEIKKALISGEDCSHLGHCMISESSLSFLCFRYANCQRSKAQNNTKERSSTLSPPYWEILQHIGWESSPLKKDAGCPAGAQGCGSVPIYYTRTHTVLEQLLICPRNRPWASQGQVCLSSWWSCFQQLTEPSQQGRGSQTEALNTHAAEISRKNTYTNTSLAIQRATLHTEEEEMNSCV